MAHAQAVVLNWHHMVSLDLMLCVKREFSMIRVYSLAAPSSL